MGLESRYDFIFRKETMPAGSLVLDDYWMVKATRDGGTTASGRTFRFTNPWVEHPTRNVGREYLVMPVGRLRDHPESYSVYEDGDYEPLSPPIRLEWESAEFFAMLVYRDVFAGEVFGAISIASTYKDIAHLMIADDSLEWIEHLGSKMGAALVVCRCDYGEWLFAPGFSVHGDRGQYVPMRSSCERDVDSFAADLAGKLASLR